jgi:hypothetical protein
LPRFGHSCLAVINQSAVEVGLSAVAKALEKPRRNAKIPAAAQELAGRLAREDVPCYVGGWHNFGGGGGFAETFDLQLDAKTTLRETKEPGYMIAAPAPLRESDARPQSTTDIGGRAFGAGSAHAARPG